MLTLKYNLGQFKHHANKWIVLGKVKNLYHA